MGEWGEGDTALFADGLSKEEGIQPCCMLLYTTLYSLCGIMSCPADLASHHMRFCPPCLVSCQLCTTCEQKNSTAPDGLLTSLCPLYRRPVEDLKGLQGRAMFNVDDVRSYHITSIYMYTGSAILHRVLMLFACSLSG